MSLTGALGAALSGIKVSSTAVQLVSSNVTNANTEGYARKTVNLSQRITSGTTGGVEITSYSRATDEVLTQTTNSAVSSSSYLSTQNNYMSQVQNILDFSSATPALSTAVSNFQSAWTEYSASSDDATSQSTVIGAGQKLASAITTVAAQISDLENQVTSDIETTVDTLNADLSQVQSLNTQITSAIAAGQQTGDLQDARDRKIKEISEIVKVQTMVRDNGQVAIYTPTGATLLDGSAQVFTASGSSVLNAAGGDLSNVLTGGKLEAQINFITDASSTTNSTSATGNGINVLAKIKSQLQNFVNMFTNTATGGFADTYNNATTNTGELASSFFTVSLDSNNLPDLTTFKVNSSLTDGSATLKQAGAESIANLFDSTKVAIDMSTTPDSLTSTFTATGIVTHNKTYAGIMTAIISTFQQSSATIGEANSTAASQKSYYESTLSSEVGVDTDTELVNLSNWQNSYSACAHVISTIQEMFKTLENMVS